MSSIEEIADQHRSKYHLGTKSFLGAEPQKAPVFYGTGVVMNGDKRPVTLNGVVDPEHMLQAICNSLEHSHETAHGITGLQFKNYSIIVHKRKGLNWCVECKFKRGETDTPSCLTHSS